MWVLGMQLMLSDVMTLREYFPEELPSAMLTSQSQLDSIDRSSRSYMDISPYSSKLAYMGTGATFFHRRKFDANSIRRVPAIWKQELG